MVIKIIFHSLGHLVEKIVKGNAFDFFPESIIKPPFLKVSTPIPDLFPLLSHSEIFLTDKLRLLNSDKRCPTVKFC